MTREGWDDPLYRPIDELPGDVTLLGGVECTVTVTDTDPGSLAAQWMADRVVSVTTRDDVEAEALAAVLPAFLAHARELADRPTRASVTLPARDIDRSRVARQAGLSVGPVVAVTELRRGGVLSGATDVEIRDAEPGDTDAAIALVLAQARYECRLGAFRLGPAIAAAIARGVADVIAGEETVLLGVRNGRAVGLVEAQPPAGSAWVSGRCALRPAAYLAIGSTADDSRASGVGTALVAELHRRWVRDGVATGLLHYTPTNPLAVPFWSRCGYRPLLASFDTMI